MVIKIIDFSATLLLAFGSSLLLLVLLEREKRVGGLDPVIHSHLGVGGETERVIEPSAVQLTHDVVS
jgi:hypothetical protein